MNKVIEAIQAGLLNCQFPSEREDAVLILRAVEDAGYKILGRKATVEMLANGREAMLPIVPRERLTTYGPVQGVWSDMFGAADTFGGQ